MARGVQLISRKWERPFEAETTRQFNVDRDALLEIMDQALKQEIDWGTIEQDWRLYLKDADDHWRSAFVPQFRGLITDQAEHWETVFGIQFDLVNLFAVELATDFFAEFMAGFGQDIMTTTKGDIAQLVAQAQLEGWSIPTMIDQLGLTFDRYIDPAFTLDGRGLTDEERQWFIDRSPRYRRENIARTSIQGGSNGGSLAIYESANVEFKEWWGTGDGRIRDTHLHAWANYSEGGTPGPIPLNGLFDVGSGRLRYPGDPMGPVEEVAQCRCTILPFFMAFPTSQAEIQATQDFIRIALEPTEEGA